AGRATTGPGCNPGAYSWVTRRLGMVADVDARDAGVRIGQRPYARAINDVKSLGRDTGTTRTADQTVEGRF
ncbi:MAG TPA: hypothetical protein VGD84_22845, partial [Pseudonocardiaceae bacterium]